MPELRDLVTGGEGGRQRGLQGEAALKLRAGKGCVVGRREGVCGSERCCLSSMAESRKRGPTEETTGVVHDKPFKANGCRVSQTVKIRKRGPKSFKQRASAGVYCMRVKFSSREGAACAEECDGAVVYHDVAWAASGGVGFCEYNSVPECGAASKMWRRETRNRGPLLLRETIPELGRNRLDQPLTLFKGNDIIEWPHVEFAAAVFRHLEREAAGGGGGEGRRRAQE